MPTPHISAQPGDFAPSVIFPGDPKRAERIAHQLLDNVRLVTNVRAVTGYTGTYRGRELSVMASGMGMPSATIYATELFTVYGVKRLVRVGTCGAIDDKIAVGDVIIAMGAHTDSNMNEQRMPGIHYSAVASFPLVEAAAHAPCDVPIHIGSVLTQDHFYFKPGEVNNWIDMLTSNSVLALEMESAGIYAAAAAAQAEALAVLTVSDHLKHPAKDMSSQEREEHYQAALRVGLEAALC